ncbi:MAG: ComEC family competence protein [Candidatus Bipolaricaulota bacterium]|nr:ComEC family competence protein [Candidatus Bipolaricaulota bacterium]MDW8031841.1 ComEC/Rec2 family competence protein [Candidatus Bipolaricaulota bacterium]
MYPQHPKFRRRPLLVVLVFFALGIFIAHTWECSFVWLAALTALVLTVTIASLFSQKLRPFSTFCTLLTCTALGALLYTNARFPAERLYEHAEKIQHIRGIVVSYPDHGPERSRFVLKPHHAPGYLQIFYDHTRDPEYFQIHYGDELIIRAPVRVPPEGGLFNYREYLRRRDIWGVIWIYRESQVQVVARRQGSLFLQWGYELRQKLFAQIERYLSFEQSALLKGLLFGERESLPKEIEASFRDAGVMHVLVASGANLGMILALLALLVSWWGFSFTKLYFLAAPVVIVYLLVVGFEVSLLRATAMFFFLTIGFLFAERGWILKRWADPLQSIATAALAILLLDPEALFDVSFQLSFAGILGIVLAMLYVWPPLIERLGLVPRPPKDETKPLRVAPPGLSLILVTLAAQLAVAPVLAYHFHQVYLWGAILGNLVIVPVATIALWGGIFLLIASAFPVSIVAHMIGGLEGLLLQLLIALSEFFARLPGAVWSF